MAICIYCNQEMLDHTSCISKIKINGYVYNRIKYGDGECEETDNIRNETYKIRDIDYIDKSYPYCGDCGCKVGEVHHFGCDQEYNPAVYGKQMLLSIFEGMEYELIK